MGKPKMHFSCHYFPTGGRGFKVVPPFNTYAGLYKDIFVCPNIISVQGEQMFFVKLNCQW